MPTFDEITQTMKRCVALLRDADIEHALGGSMAAWAHGGPPVCSDVDIVLRPADAERALQTLTDAGFEAERPPEGWLLKAHDGVVLVDLIFEPNGLDVEDSLARASTLSVLSVDMKVITVDDVLITKLLAFEEHYIDFVGLLPIARALREQADWERVRACTSRSAIAVGFFAMAEALGIVAPAGAARQQRIRVSTA